MRMYEMGITEKGFERMKQEIQDEEEHLQAVEDSSPKEHDLLDLLDQTDWSEEDIISIVGLAQEERIMFEEDCFYVRRIQDRTFENITSYRGEEFIPVQH